MEFLKKINFKKYEDNRGVFNVLFENGDYDRNFQFSQIMHVSSKKHVFRGMHIQNGKYAQSKIFTLINGEIIDFIVDLRRNSKDFLKVFHFNMNKSTNYSLFIPKGYAHGYYVKSKSSLVQYAVDLPLSDENYYSISYKDHHFNFSSFFDLNKSIVSKKDKNGISVQEFLKISTL